MRKLPLVPIPVLLALLAGACQQPASPRTAERVAADMDALRTQWQELANADDFAGVANLYTEDAVFVAPDGSVHDGRAAITAYFEKSFPQSTGFTAQTVGTVVSGDMAAAYGTWSDTETLPAGDQVVGGMWQTVGVYQADGLKIRLHLAMIPAVAPDAATPAAAPAK